MGVFHANLARRIPERQPAGQRYNQAERSTANRPSYARQVHKHEDSHVAATSDLVVQHHDEAPPQVVYLRGFWRWIRSQPQCHRVHSAAAWGNAAEQERSLECEDDVSQC